MQCPVCQPARWLEATPLEEGRLVAYGCPGCGGRWIRSADYWRWRALHGPNLPEVAAPVPPTAVETAGLHLCPDCGYVLGRFRVGHGLPFHVERCRNCEGAWLDGGEWDALKARNLHDDLPLMFDDAWQREVRAQASAQATEESFRRRLGDADYARAREVRAWLDGHPRRSEVFAYLQLDARGRAGGGPG